MIKRMFNKYCLVFLIITLIVLLGSSIVSANEDTDHNTILGNTNSIECDNTGSVILNDNDNKIEKKEATSDNDKTDTTTSKLTKDDKNLKTVNYPGTLTMNASSGYPGDVVELHLVHPAQLSVASDYKYNITLDNTIYQTGDLEVTLNRNAYINFTVPDVTDKEYMLNVSVMRSKNRNIVGSDTFTVLPGAPKLNIENDTTIEGYFNNFILPVNVRDKNGTAVNVATNVTISDGDEVLIDNYPITEADNNILIPVKRTGEYPLTIVFNATDVYGKSTCKIQVNVLPLDIILTIDDNENEINTTINVVSNTVITGTLTTVNSDPVRNADISIVVDGDEFPVTTDDNGRFSYQYPVTELKTDIPISVGFSGCDGYNPANGLSGTFDIKIAELVVTFDEVEQSDVNDITHITGTVTDTQGTLLDNAEFNLTISGVDEVATVRSTNGTFSYDHVFTQTGTNTVTASRDLTSGLYQMDDASIEFTTVVGLKRTKLTVDVGEGSDYFINITGVEAYVIETITTGRLVDIDGIAVADAEITVLINDKTVPTTTDANGDFNVVYNATQGLKTYNISIKFEGNDNYKAASEEYSGVFTTNPLDVKVYLNDDLNDDYLIDEEVVISGYATILNSAYANEEVGIIIDEVNYTAITDDEGSFTYTYTPTAVGVITISTQESTLSINVIKPEVSVILDDISDFKVFVAKDITGRLMINSNQIGISDNIVLTINDESFDVKTNADGTFTYTYTPTTLGVNNVSVSFESNQYTTTTCDSKTFNVGQLKTRLVSDELALAVRVNEAFTISGKLVDEVERPIADANIRIIVNGQNYSTTTSSEGIYSFDYPAMVAGENNLYEVRYSGDEIHDLARNYVGSFFDVEALIAHITVSVNDTSVNNHTSITGIVSTSDDTVLAYVNVKVYVNGEEVGEATTNTDGVYTLEYTPTTAGKKDVKAVISDDNHPKRSAESSFNVAKATTTITINPIIITSNYERNVTAIIVDSYNNPVPSGKVVFKINGKTVKDENKKILYVNVTNGQAVVSHTFTQQDIIKNINISATYSGTTDFGSSSSAKVNLTLLDQQYLNMTLNNVTARAGDNITLQVTIKELDENVNGGKVVFKLNGKTIKDGSGKVIYSMIEDGIATCNYTLASTLKAKNYTITAVLMHSLYNKTETTATLTVTNYTPSNTVLSSARRILKDGTPQTIIINNDTIATYITNTGLTDLVHEGDTLDFQGTIAHVEGLSTIIIDKPVNIITSTNDGRIELFNNITYTRGASGSNITGLFTFNTQFYVVNADNMVFDNISNVVDNKGIGSGVGQTSIREICTNITVKNSLIKTINNGGFSSLVFTYVSYSNVINNTIIGEGRVGNLFYFNIYNAGQTSTLGNAYNVIANNTIIGPDKEDSICYGMGMSAARGNLIENNTITYPGDAMRGGSADTIIRNNIINGGRLLATGIITNNTINNNGSLNVSKNSIAENNTVHGTLIAGANSVVQNNVAENLMMGNNATVSNLTITGNVTYIVNGTIVSDSVLKNCSIGGDIVVSCMSRNSIAERNKIQNNIIGGNITVSQSKRLTIANNTINGTINITSNKAGNTTITRNNITTNNEYTIINYNETTTISYNQLITNDSIASLTINDISGSATIIKNGPAVILNVTMENYSEFFDETGIFNKTLNDESILVLHGEFSNVLMRFDRDELKAVAGFDENTILNDCTIVINGNAHMNVENITFIITDENNYENLALIVESNNTNITNNVINVTSNHSIFAVLIKDSKNTTIINNRITADSGYAIYLINSNNTVISDNYMNTTMGKNDYAVFVNNYSQNVSMSGNTPDNNIVEISVIATGVIGNLTDITINFVDGTDGGVISDGTAYVMINGELLEDTNGNTIFSVINGQICLADYEIPVGWLRSDAEMTVVYSGTSIYKQATINTGLDISKREANVEILSTDITTSIGDTITLQARINDGDALVTSGKVAFKLNGNTLEDDSGNLIFVDVVNGIATLDYTINSDFGNDSYELTAVFENMLYYRASDSAELTIEG